MGANRGWYPCCGCTIFEDTFTRGDSNDPGGDYTIEAGDWDIDTSQLVCSDSDSLILIDVFHATELENIFEVKMVFDNEGDQLQVVTNYEDNANYWFVELECGVAPPAASTGVIRLYQREAGVNNLIDSDNTLPIVPGGDIDLQVCLNTLRLSCNFEEEAGVVINLTTITPAVSGQVGLATGTLTGKAAFDNVLLQRHATNKAGCPDCYVACEYVCNWREPDSVTVTHGSVIAGDVTTMRWVGTTYILAPDAGGLDATIFFEMGEPSTPVSVSFNGANYNAAPGKSIDLYYWDFVAEEWDLIETWNHFIFGDEHTNALSSDHISSSGEVRTRFQTDDVDVSYRLNIVIAHACHDHEPPDEYEVDIVSTGWPALDGPYTLTRTGVQTWEYTFDPVFDLGGGSELRNFTLTLNNAVLGWPHTMQFAANVDGVPSSVWTILLDPPAFCGFTNLTMTTGTPNTLVSQAPVVSAVL